MSDAAESSTEETKVSDRYELSDLFSDENEDTQGALKVIGVLILFGLMVYALSLPFRAFLDLKRPERKCLIIRNHTLMGLGYWPASSFCGLARLLFVSFSSRSSMAIPRPGVRKRSRRAELARKVSMSPLSAQWNAIRGLS